MSKPRDEKTAARCYIKVCEEQREILIDLMVQNESMTLREACDILNLNYESARAIWS